MIPSKNLYGCSRDDRGVSREHPVSRVVVGNLPYAVMILLGVGVIVLGLGASPARWLAAAAYLAYGVLGSFWIISFVCPHCPSYGDRSCPCGYGVLSAKLRPQGDTTLFTKKFKEHIPVIVPLWIVPVLTGGLLIFRSFSWPLAILLGTFILESFVILPLVSKRHGCKNCSQREACPWMSLER